MRKLLIAMLVLSLLLQSINIASAGSKPTNKRTPDAKAYSVVPFENQPLRAEETSTIERIDPPIQLTNEDGVTILDQLPQVADAVYGDHSTVTGSVYGKNARMMTTMSNPTPPPGILSAISNLNMKNIQSPFQINAGAESISPVSGQLDLQETDLSLPGRNGLSFSLNRYYDSSAANVYDKELSFGLFCYCVLYYDATRYKETYNTNNGVTTRSYIDDGRFMMDYNHVPDSSTMTNSYYAMRWLNYIIRRAGQVAFANNWSQPDSNGIQTRTIQEIKTNHNSYMDARYYDFGNGYGGIVWTDVATNKPYQEQLYPLGTGWTWDIPYIKTEFGDKRFLNMGSKGTYEMVNNTLKGYPWKDLTVLTDTTVVVNQERSNVAIKSLDGIYQHFATDGRLIQISDAYNNTIQFKYSQDAKYGKVLTSITDAINNSITIAYADTSITLTQGDKVVRYDKGTQYRENPRPPFETLSNEYLTQVTDPLGRVTRYNYQEKSAKFSITGTTPTEKNPLLLLIKVTYPTGASTNYTYAGTVTNRLLGASASEQVYRMQSRKDVGNNREFNKLDFTYHSDIGSSAQDIASFGTTIQNGLKSTTFDYRKAYVDDSSTVYTKSIVETAGDEKRTATFQYDAARRITNPIVTTNTFSKAGTNATPTIERVSYDDYGNVLSQTNPLNVTTTFSYHPTTHLLAASTERVDANQTRNTTYERNAKGKVTAIIVTNQAGTKLAHSKFEQIDNYGNIGKTTILDDDRNMEYVMEYGYSGALPTKQTVQVTDSDGQPSTIENKLEYDSSTGWVTSFTNGNHQPGNNHRTTYQYDKLGRLTTVTNPDQSRMTASYNDVTNQVTVVDETGVTSIQKWDQLGRKMEEGIIDGGYRVVKQYDYDAWSRPLWEQNGSGHRTSYQYDAWNRVSRTTLPNGAYTTMGYDELNRTATSTDPLGIQSRTTADLLGREILSQINKGAGFQQLSSTQYDDMGNITFSTDAQHTTKYQYDAMGRMTAVTDPKNDTTSYAYSLAGFLKEIRYPDATTTQKRYDQLGRLVRQTDALGQFEKMYYDKNSNLTATVDQKGQIFYYHYNNRNFLTGKSGPNDNVTYTYDLSGRRKTMADSTGTTNYTYKGKTGELIEVQFPDTKRISYTYNQLGLRDTMTGPFGQVNVYTYDNLNRLKTVGSSTTAFEAEYDYYNNNLLKEIKQKNGNKSTFTYDGYSINTLIHTKANGSEINYFDYDYDGNGNITGQTVRQNGPLAAYGYSYDSLNRIATSSQFNETYTYNNRGNRIALKSDRMPDIPVGETNYTYDAWNRLTSVSKSGEGQVSYRYNGDGLLYERTENNTTVRYYYDGDQVIAEGIVANGNVTMKAEYTRGKGLIARQDSSGKQYYLHNGHGDVVELRNSTGDVSLNRYTYDMWGNPLTTVESVANPFRYSGELWDQSAGLQYLRARWYDPSVGRFISKDTYEGQIDNPLTMNLYTYVHNNPLIHVDPTGHLTFKAAWYISRGSQDYLINSAIDGVKAVFSPSTYKAVWNLSKEIYNGNISINAIIGAVGENLSEPFVYLGKYGEHVLNGKPTKDEAYAYGQNYAKALTVLQSVFAAGITLTPKVASAFKNSVNLLNSFKTIKANVSDLVKNPLDEFDYNRGNYNAKALKAAREYINENGTISSPIVVKILDDGTMQIVDGHHRWWAAKQSGLKKVPIKVEK